MRTIPAIRNRLIGTYLVMFFITCLIRTYQEHWMSYLQPVFYADTFNMVTWGLRLSGWLNLLSRHHSLLIFLDIFFVTVNLVIPAMAMRKNVNGLILLLLGFNFLYTNTSAAMTMHTMETQLSWLLMPVLFFQLEENRWIVVFSFLRYFFLFYFFSAGFWKIVRHSFLDPTHMQNVLLLQHQDLLALNRGWWVTNVYEWFIKHPFVAQGIFMFATLLELSFLTGFFTWKYDRVFFALYCGFVIADLVFMRILFGETVALATILMVSPFVQQLTRKISPHISVG